MIEVIVTVLKPAEYDVPASMVVYRGEFREADEGVDRLMRRLSTDTSCVHWAKLRDA